MCLCRKASFRWNFPMWKAMSLPTTASRPLAHMTDWVNTTCPCCGGPAKRETDTMPQWAGSSWYFLRYTDPTNDNALASPEALKYWMPVDWYNGGMEHTTLHLAVFPFLAQDSYMMMGVVPCSRTLPEENLPWYDFRLQR